MSGGGERAVTAVDGEKDEASWRLWLAHRCFLGGCQEGGDKGLHEIRLLDAEDGAAVPGRFAHELAESSAEVLCKLVDLG